MLENGKGRVKDGLFFGGELPCETVIIEGAFAAGNDGGKPGFGIGIGDGIGIDDGVSVRDTVGKNGVAFGLEIEPVRDRIGIEMEGPETGAGEDVAGVSGSQLDGGNGFVGASDFAGGSRDQAGRGGRGGGHGIEGDGVEAYIGMAPAPYAASVVGVVVGIAGASGSFGMARSAVGNAEEDFEAAAGIAEYANGGGTSGEALNFDGLGLHKGLCTWVEKGVDELALVDPKAVYDRVGRLEDGSEGWVVGIEGEGNRNSRSENGAPFSAVAA